MEKTSLERRAPEIEGEAWGLNGSQYERSVFLCQSPWQQAAGPAVCTSAVPNIPARPGAGSLFSWEPRGAQDCLASTHAGSVLSAVFPVMREPLPLPGTWLPCPVSRHSPGCTADYQCQSQAFPPPAPLSVCFGFTGFACFLRQGLFCSLG